MASEIRNRFTDTEMQIARETDLPELLSHLGYQVKRVGRFHTTTEMDSLQIKDRRTWFRYSQNTGGDAITFLQQFCEKSFPEAVEYLLTFHGKARDAPVPQPKPISQKQALSLPPRNADDRRVFAYLRKRGIAAQVIRQFLNAGLLYRCTRCGYHRTVTLKQTERRKKNKKIAAAVYLYQADNDGEWGKLRFDFENGTAEIVRLADWDTVKSNIFAKTAIRFVQRLPEARLLKSVVVPFEMGISEKPALPASTAKATKINPAHTISLRQTECRKTGETITAAVYQYLVDNDGEWGELRFDFENGTAEIVKLADWDTVKSNVFAKAAIQYVRYLLRQASTKQVIVLYVK